MTIESSLYGVLSGIVTTFPVTAPDSQAAPFCIYSRVSSSPNNNLAGGAPGLERIRYQIDVHATTAAQARSLAASIKSALGALTTPGFEGYIVDDRDLYEPDVKLFRAMIDWECWA